MERTTMIPHTSSQMSVASGLAYGSASATLSPQQPERFSTAATSSYVTYSNPATLDQHEQHTFVERTGLSTTAGNFGAFAGGAQEYVTSGDIATRAYSGGASQAHPQMGQSSQVTPLGGFQSSQVYSPTPVMREAAQHSPVEIKEAAIRNSVVLQEAAHHTPVVEASMAYDAVNVEDPHNLGGRPLSGTNYVANAQSEFLRHPQAVTTPAAADLSQAAMPPSDVSKLPPECFTPIAVGDKLPTAHIDLHGVCVNLQEFFEDRCGILFGLVGAFYPLDTKKAVPELLRCMDSFEKQVDFVGCLVVNDPFVVKAWAKRLGMTDQFTFVADADAKFTKALGMAQYLPEKGLGLRSRRFALVVGPRSKIQWVGFDEEAFASSVLQVVPRFVRTPWKSFIVGVSYDKKKGGDSESQVGNSVTEAISSIRLQLTHQGFCSEADWQLVLSDNIPDIFKPTRENIMSGLKWLVEGTQAGDVLCLYFAGRGHRTVNPDGSETRGILPMDWETAGIITETDLYDILAANVPEYCRMTIILDIEGEESVQCPLPYCAPCLQTTEGESGVHLIPVSAPNEAWVNKFQVEERPKGEVLTISLEGPGRVPAGCLANLMNTTVSTELRDPVSEESDQPQIVEIPISFRDKMDRMTTQLQEWGLQKYVMFGSSFPLDLKEDFSLADILPQAHQDN